MPAYRKRTIDRDPLEGARAELRESEKQAGELDADPEAPGKPEKENLVLVLYDQPDIIYNTHSRQKLDSARLDLMNTPEILAVGWDRSYWKRGVAKLDRAGLIAFFLTAQEEDTSLDG